MKAMILAAGRGERMRPLTDTCPKPLLKVNGIPLIEYHIKNLAAAGITDIVINHAWLGQKLVDYLADGKQFSVNITYSEEPVALETAGGIIKALPLLANNEQDTFIVVNGDVYCDYDFNDLPDLASEVDAHLLLVRNPKHNAKGDFQLAGNKLINLIDNQQTTYTFSGIALYKKRFFSQNVAEELHSVAPLAPMLRAGAQTGKITANVIDNAWTDVGTPERLAQLNQN